jgi:hypothetical protein
MTRTAIVTAAEQLIDAIIDWRDEHPDEYTGITGEDCERVMDLCNMLRTRFDEED